MGGIKQEQKKKEVQRWENLRSLEKAQGKSFANPEHYATSNCLDIGRYSNSKLVWLNLILSENLL